MVEWSGDGCRRCAGTAEAREETIQTAASKTGDTESVDEDRNYEKVCFTGSHAIISIRPAETAFCTCV
jgi:hypothetical protein